MTKRAITDIGGLPAGPINPKAAPATPFAKHIDAMMMVLRQEPNAFWRTDENRRTIESFSPDVYANAAYYERWLLAMRALLIEKAVLSEAEISAKIEELRKRLKASS